MYICNPLINHGEEEYYIKSSEFGLNMGCSNQRSQWSSL